MEYIIVNTSDEVFDNENLLLLIFGFEGSLTYFAKNCSEVIGWSDFKHSPSSTESHLSDNDPRQFNREPNHSRMMVCKRWFRFFAGSIAFKHAEKEIQSAHQKELDAARIAKDDSDLPWTVRFFAMAMVNDIEQFSEKYRDSRDESSAIGNSMQSFLANPSAVIAEIDSSCPFKEIFLSLWVQTRTGRDSDSSVLDFPKRCAVVAAIYGSTQVLEFSQNELYTAKIWEEQLGLEGYTGTAWDSKRRTVLMDMVVRVCRQPILASQTKILDGIRQSLVSPYWGRVSSTEIERMISTAPEEFSGPLLHFAAGSGCLELVQLLVETGIPPTFLHNGKTASEWAHTRRSWVYDVIGHVEVVDKFDSVVAYLEGVIRQNTLSLRADVCAEKLFDKYMLGCGEQNCQDVNLSALCIQNYTEEEHHLAYARIARYFNEPSENLTDIIEMDIQNGKTLWEADSMDYVYELRFSGWRGFDVAFTLAEILRRNHWTPDANSVLSLVSRISIDWTPANSVSKELMTYYFVYPDLFGNPNRYILISDQHRINAESPYESPYVSRK